MYIQVVMYVVIIMRVVFALIVEDVRDNEKN